MWGVGGDSHPPEAGLSSVCEREVEPCWETKQSRHIMVMNASFQLPSSCHVTLFTVLP